MSTASRSSLKVQYDLRPAKQVERRMLVDAFQRLSQLGFPIRDYQYTGFGSLYFMDFILFHKLLGITHMLNVEHDRSLERRVLYNRPFDCISIAMMPASEVIPTLAMDRQHILWLDYDFSLNRDVLEDVFLAGSQLSHGSVILITVDVEPPYEENDEPNESKKYFEDQCGNYLGLRIIDDFTKSNLPGTCAQIILNALNEGMSGRRDVNYCPMFNFLYADGHKMLTIGGMISSRSDKLKLRSIDTDAAFYLRLDMSIEPYEIKIPRVTRKERHLLDAAMPCIPGWQPEEIELPQEFIESYRQIYRFLPAYAELLI